MPINEPNVKVTRIDRPERMTLSSDEVRKRMQEFTTQRRSNFISSVREGGQAAAQPSDSGDFNRCPERGDFNR